MEGYTKDRNTTNGEQAPEVTGVLLGSWGRKALWETAHAQRFQKRALCSHKFLGFSRHSKEVIRLQR